MSTSHEERRWRTRAARLVVAAVLVTAVHAVSATTYMSVEPIPHRDVIGEGNLALLRSIGYDRLARWSELLLSQCLVVDRVIEALTTHGAITSVVVGSNTELVVAAGGFEGATNPSYVFTIKDSGTGAASLSDVNVLDNALGYVLSQGGTVHFSPDNHKAYAFALDYAVVTFDGTLSGDDARLFFEQLGQIDPALFSGQFAGFTQIDFAGSPTNNSMLFLQPAVSKRRFISGLAAAAGEDTRATYFPLKNNGAPTTERAGIAFPGNDWLAAPGGEQYLANVGGTPQLEAELLVLQTAHRDAVRELLAAIADDRVDAFLDQFSCPTSRETSTSQFAFAGVPALR
jgi:hypothetical protein